MKQRVYQERLYRKSLNLPDLVNFEIKIEETDLFICADKDLTAEVRPLLLKYRSQIKEYIKTDPAFLTSLRPIDIKPGAPSIVSGMAYTSRCAGVGPMAAVAGAIAEYIGLDLLAYTKELIIENGGDIFIKTNRTRVIGLYAGEESVFSNRLSIRIKPDQTPLGVATSSGTVGHSLSFGMADSVTILSKSALLADAAATAVCNMVKEDTDVNRAVEFAKSIDGVSGVLIAIRDTLGVWGDVNLAN